MLYGDAYLHCVGVLTLGGAGSGKPCDTQTLPCLCAVHRVNVPQGSLKRLGSKPKDSNNRDNE